MKRIQTTNNNASDQINALQNALLFGKLGRRRFIAMAIAAGASLVAARAMAQTLGDAAVTQLYNSRNLAPAYDYIVVGSGSGGAVVAGRLAAETDATVLVLEAGGTDQVDSVLNPVLWSTNIMSDLDWKYLAEPSDKINGRSLILPMGKVVGGGSSINGTVWARGHKRDWDLWAEQTGNKAWNYENVLKIYRRIEDWQGTPDEARRGKGGRLWVEAARDPLPIVPAMLKAAESIGIPTFDDMNGVMMEGTGGAAVANLRVKGGLRRNVPMDYLYGALHKPNITLLTGATVLKLDIEGTRVTGVTFEQGGKTETVRALERVVLSAGAINTPKLLMVSGIGRAQDLEPLGIRVRQNLQGVGQGFQDHILAAGCVWEYKEPLAPRNNGAEATFFWKSDPSLDRPDLQPFQIEGPVGSEVTSKLFDLSAGGWTIAPGLVRPKSRGEVRLTSGDPRAPVRIDAAFLKEEADMKALLRGIEICREIGNSEAMKDFVKREIMPGPLMRENMADFARNAAGTYYHESCTCKMGQDSLSVVDSNLSVYGVDALSIADASVMPEITTGNTMAPTVIIGERLADVLIG